MINYEFAGNTAFDGVDVNSLYNNYAARYCYNKIDVIMMELSLKNLQLGIYRLLMN